MRCKKTFTYIMICAIVCIQCFDAVADVIKLNNGCSIEGYIIEKTNHSCLVQTSLGTMDLSLNDIENIKYESVELNLTFLAQEYMADDKFKEAIDCYNQALYENPNYKPAQNGLKLAKKKSEKYEKEIKTLEEKKLEIKAKIEKSILKTYGVELKINMTSLEVINVLPDSQAAESGLRSQDLICEVNSRNLLRLQGNEIFKLLQEEFDNVESICFYRKYTLQPTEIKYLFKKQKVLGIILVENDNYIEIDEVIKNSSADLAGLKENDRIKEINGKNIKGKSLKEIAYITKKMDKVDLLILRCLR